MTGCVTLSSENIRVEWGSVSQLTQIGRLVSRCDIMIYMAIIRLSRLWHLGWSNFVVGDRSIADWNHGTVQLRPVISSKSVPEHSHLWTEINHRKQGYMLRHAINTTSNIWRNFVYHSWSQRYDDHQVIVGFGMVGHTEFFIPHQHACRLWQCSIFCSSSAD